MVYLAPDKLVQSRPAEQFHSVLLQVKIVGQNGFDVGGVGALLHWVVQFDHPAELVAVTVLCVGQYELRVVLHGHVTNLPLAGVSDCETEHNFPDETERCAEI
jgi:hypothetical protein